MRFSARAVSATSASGVGARSASGAASRRQDRRTAVESATWPAAICSSPAAASEDRPQQRPVALVQVDARAQAAADRVGIVVGVHLRQALLDLEQLVDRLAAHPNEEIAEVVEVAIEDRAARDRRGA
jgi:hypothetical protein